MKINKNIINPITIAVSFLLLSVIAELISILILNNGILVYTLDDAYIHLSLAENILNGHYGINLNEFSSPSSSILWPFLIAPFSFLEIFPFLINLIAAVFNVVVFSKILNISLNITNEQIKKIIVTSTLIVLILATNLVGLIFCGMEHSLQVLLVTLIAYGLILEIEKNKVENWLIFVIIISPLIRYENLAISLSALTYLFLRKNFKKSIFSFFLIVFFTGIFSVFLISLCLDSLPNSVFAKSEIVSSSGKLSFILNNLHNSLAKRQGVFLTVGILFLISFSLFIKETNKKQFAITSSIAIFLHLLFGNYGWYNRYEIYVWTFLILIIIYFLSPYAVHLIEKERANIKKIIFVLICFLSITSIRYVIDLFTIPLASNNIYEQHHQMHRFAVDFYKKPIAVNDIGYVSYKNDNFVLDLAGLSSKEALNYWKNGGNIELLSSLVKKRNIELIMIYKDLLINIPNEWLEVGDLKLEKKRITPAGSNVTFFATNQIAYQEIKRKLELFKKTLPSSVNFTFKDN